MDNYDKIIKILNDLKISFEEIEHPISHSCEESKAFRDASWLKWLWSKNIIFHCKWEFYLVTTHWDKQIKARNFKHEFGSKDIRFAYQEEITSLIASTIWSIPPFWFNNDNLRIYVDCEIFESDYFIFNPSIPTKSIRISTESLKNVYSYLPNIIKYFTHKDEIFEISENI